MSKALSVFLKGKYAGIISTDNGNVVFEYDKDYNGIPLSMSMPVINRKYGQKYVIPWLDGVISSEPYQRLGLQERLGLKKHNPIDILTVMGLDCAGAVQFTKCGEENKVGEYHIELVNREYIANQTIIEHLDPDYSRPWAAEGMNWSLSGCQRKGAYILADKHWYAPFGAAATTHIIKPGVLGLTNEAFSEAWTMKLASLCGISAANVEYEFFNGHGAIVVERFDRINEHRVHQEDFCQLLHYGINQKYSDHGGPSTVDMLKAINTYTNKYRDYSIIEFTKQLFFNYLTLSTDGHAQNYSMQILDDGAKLAPMYDAATFAPYYKGGRRPLRMAMSIGGENRKGSVSLNNVKKYAEFAGIEPDIAYDIMINLTNDIQTYADDAYFEALNNFYRHDDTYYSTLYEDGMKWINNHCETIRKSLLRG